MYYKIFQRIKKLIKDIFKEYNVLPCPLCESGNGNGDNHFCDDCKLKLSIISGLRCRGCGSENSGFLSICKACSDEPLRPWNNAFSLFHYENEAKEMLHKFKFQNHPELSYPICILAVEELNKLGMNDFTVIVPVPLHYTNYYARTYNQSYLIAKNLSKLLDIPLEEFIVRKKRKKKQSTLAKEARRKNPKGIFEIKKNLDLSGHKILLVDDIFTTGSTLHHATKLLQKSNCSDVTIFTVARTPFWK